MIDLMQYVDIVIVSTKGVNVIGERFTTFQIAMAVCQNLMFSLGQGASMLLILL